MLAAVQSEVFIQPSTHVVPKPCGSSALMVVSVATPMPAPAVPTAAVPVSKMVTVPVPVLLTVPLTVELVK